MHSKIRRPHGIHIHIQLIYQHKHYLPSKQLDVSIARERWYSDKEKKPLLSLGDVKAVAIPMTNVDTNA